MVELLHAIRYDGEQDSTKLPPGAHGEVDRWTGRRFICVQANGACIEIQPGWWIAYADDGHSYPIPPEFVSAEPRYSREELEALIAKAFEAGWRATGVDTWTLPREALRFKAWRDAEIARLDAPAERSDR